MEMAKNATDWIELMITTTASKMSLVTINKSMFRLFFLNFLPLLVFETESGTMRRAGYRFPCCKLLIRNANKQFFHNLAISFVARFILLSICYFFISCLILTSYPHMTVKTNRSSVRFSLLFYSNYDDITHIKLRKNYMHKNMLYTL